MSVPLEWKQYTNSEREFLSIQPQPKMDQIDNKTYKRMNFWVHEFKDMAILADPEEVKFEYPQAVLEQASLNPPQ